MTYKRRQDKGQCHTTQNGRWKCNSDHYGFGVRAPPTPSSPTPVAHKGIESRMKVMESRFRALGDGWGRQVTQWLFQSIGYANGTLTDVAWRPSHYYKSRELSELFHQSEEQSDRNSHLYICSILIPFPSFRCPHPPTGLHLDFDSIRIWNWICP